MVLAENGACLTLLRLQRRKPTENMTITEIASATRLVYFCLCEQQPGAAGPGGGTFWRRTYIHCKEVDNTLAAWWRYLLVVQIAHPGNLFGKSRIAT